MCITCRYTLGRMQKLTQLVCVPLIVVYIYILDVMSGFEINGFDLYTDNYYTSPEL